MARRRASNAPSPRASAAPAPDARPDAGPDAATALAPALLAWWQPAARALPWRETRPGRRPDPYRVWLSEIMLQQTTAAAVAPRFLEFVARWPSVHDLAATPRDAVLAAWSGLGYYARARNLHDCARAVVRDFGGRFPENLADLRALPGIGAYTAGAIAAIAFDRPAAAVDGNAERVIARVFAVETPMPAAKRELGTIAETLVPESRPGDFAQALMDLGATLCTPKAPRCGTCPLHGLCLGRVRGIAARLPVKVVKKLRPERRGAAFVARAASGRVLLVRRPERGLLGAMYGPPVSAFSEDLPPTDDLAHAPFAARWRRRAEPVVHVFTHFRLTLSVYEAEVAGEVECGGVWAAPDELSRFGLPTVMRKALGGFADQAISARTR